MAVLNSVIQCCQTKRRILFGDRNDRHGTRWRSLTYVDASLSELVAILQAMDPIAVPGRLAAAGRVDNICFEQDPVLC